MDVYKIREDFPILSRKIRDKPLVYLDSAATSQKPRQVIEALSRFYLEEYGTVHRGIYELTVQATEKYNASRSYVASFLHAASDEEIIFTRGTTGSINLVARSYGETFVKEGDEIIISEMEHHSNIVPWQMLAERKKAILKVVPINDLGELRLDRYVELLSPRTKIVSMAHMANSTGTIHPIREIIKEAHRFGAKVLIDGAQGAPHLFVDVQDLDVDFYAFSSHKTYGPTGVGVLYGKKELLEKMPPVEGGGDMIDSVTFKKTTYQGPPLRFEAGTPIIAEVIALKEALQYIDAIGRKNIEKWEKELLLYATKRVEEIPHIKIIGQAKEK
ncbi:MAG: SufS family cysteine desulfurase, partial [Chlamydiota bacterium]